MKDSKQIIKLLRQALELLEEPEPDPTAILENAIKATLRPGSTWMPSTEIYHHLENHLQEELAPNDPLRVGRLLTKLKFKRHIKKISNVTTIGYYATRKNQSTD